eukprot:gene6761-9263_t
MENAAEQSKEQNLDGEEDIPQIDPKTLKPELYAATVANDTTKVLSLLEQQVPPTFVDSSNGWTPLHWATLHGNFSLVKALLSNGASEPYHRMIAKEKKLALKGNKDSKLQQDSKAMEKTVENETFGEEIDPNNLAADESKFDTINESVLDDEDEDEEEEDDIEKLLEISTNLLVNTPLLWATQKGFLYIVWLLLVDGYSPNHLDSMGNNAVHLAAGIGNLKLLKVLVDDGGISTNVNNYKNMPIDMAKNKETREYLSTAMIAGASITEEDIATKHEQTLKTFSKMINNLGNAINEASRINSPRAMKGVPQSNASKLIQNLSEAIEMGKDWSLDLDMIAEAEKLLIKLELSQEFLSDIQNLQKFVPIRTQSVYLEHVYKLEKSIERADSGGIDKNQLQIGLDLITRCQIEYWVSVLLDRLKDVEAATDANEHDMNRLKQAVQKAQALHASDSLVEEAIKFLGRLDAELGMTRALKAIPVPKMPIENPPEGYYTERDIGKVKETEEYPLPPTDSGEYIWIPAESYSAFIQSIDNLKASYHGSEAYGANPVIIAEAKDRLMKAEKELKILDAKDQSDKLSAIEAVKKLAKKLKAKSKGGGKKKA